MISTRNLNVYDQVIEDGRIRSVASVVQNGLGSSVILIDGYTGAVTSVEVRRGDLDTPRWEVMD